MSYFVSSNVYTMKCALLISLSKAPVTPTLQELSNALHSVIDWHSLGVKLGVKDHELSTIDKNFRGDNERCKHEMLDRWLRSAKLPTWKAVAGALQLMGERKIALKMLDKHCISSNTTGMCALTFILELRTSFVCKGQTAENLE